jgi:hypothetical protein
MKPFYELLCLLWFKKIKTTLLFINLTGIITISRCEFFARLSALSPLLGRGRGRLTDIQKPQLPLGS